MLHVRPVSEPDLPRVLELFTIGFGLPAAPPLDYVRGLVHSEPEGCFVGLQEGRIVGYACSHRAGRVGYVGNLAVDEAVRGQGIGKRLTLAARDHLGRCCDVVGLAVDPAVGRNLGLYAACGFEPTLPACDVGRWLDPGRSRRLPPDVRDARELGADLGAVLAEVAGWSHEALPGLDLTRDLRLLGERHPTRVLFHGAPGTVRGVIAFHPHLRGDPFLVVRPGAEDARVFDDLVAGLEAAVPEDLLQFQFHTTFQRVQGLLAARGYRVAAHRSCLVWSERRAGWPERSSALFVRPWWS